MMKEEILNRLQVLLQEALELIPRAAHSSNIETLRQNLIGKKGRLTEILRSIGQLSAEDKPVIGQEANVVKAEIEQLLSAQSISLNQVELQNKIQQESIDITLPGTAITYGSEHLISRTFREIQDIFAGIGYTVAEGPEIEDEWHNFTALNIPADHPSRDMHDTFFLEDGRVLRTHTSPVQIHVMTKQQPPIRILAPGRVYRCDNDATHSPVFHQVEGLALDDRITMGDLKGTLEYFLQAMFGKDKKVRFRPSYFPFTEPSAEVDVQCVQCGGSGCRLCKKTGWIEIMGCGMVDPNVLKSVNYDPHKVQGFAFGMGVERIAMLKHGVTDIKYFYQNDIRFLRQF